MAIVKTDSRHYSDIASAIRSKTGGSAQYRPEEMPDAILGLETGSLESSIIVHAAPGSQISLTRENVVRTVPENDGIWRFDNCALGTWTVVATKYGTTVYYPVEIAVEGQLMRYDVHVVYNKSYGVMRDITSSSPAWTRTGDSQGKSATASTGTVAGHSDFDQCYPWSGMKRETLPTGDVMVKIPKFWYKRYREGNIEYLVVSDVGTEEFRLHPAFSHGGVEQDAIYVGAYKMSESYGSKTGVLPKNNTTRADFRTGIAAKGAGWSMMDLSTLSALQMLYLVEFADYNSQQMVGRGICTYTQAGGERKVTGTTDAVPNLTGTITGTSGRVNVVWRGIEGLWGNMLEFLDGLNVDCTTNTYYVCNDTSAYTDTVTGDYTALSFGLPAASNTGSYITKAGLDPAYDYIMLPAVIDNGSSTTYLCDVVCRNTSGGVVCPQYGAEWYCNDKGGLFKLDCLAVTTSRYSYGGVRLIYIPQEVSV